MFSWKIIQNSWKTADFLTLIQILHHFDVEFKWTDDLEQPFKTTREHFPHTKP